MLLTPENFIEVSNAHPWQIVSRSDKFEHIPRFVALLNLCLTIDHRETPEILPLLRNNKIM
jgi:hypothetical protein